MNRSPYSLGATLYMPATRTDLLQVVSGNKIKGLQSLVLCLEDAVSESDTGTALMNLRALLLQLEEQGYHESTNRPLVFVRPRSIAMGADIDSWAESAQLDGYVLPKVEVDSVKGWSEALANPDHCLMPTLETANAFDPYAMVELRNALSEYLGERILALRIGGNDLMSCIGARRPKGLTAYDTPLGYAIPMVAGVMGAAGFKLTAPVFERLDRPDLLQLELERDIACGLVGKTAIHPTQIQAIRSAFRVTREDVNSALAILNDQAPAVFRLDNAMCEPATHRSWASGIIARAHHQGVIEKAPNIVGLQNSMGVHPQWVTQI